MQQTIADFIESKWDSECIPKLEEYIRIPCQSPGFDKDWESNGLLDDAMDLLHDWVKQQDVPGLTSKVMHETGRTPFMIVQVPGTVEGFGNRILMYGHMDKQPPLDLELWSEGLSPYNPVIRDGKLYGRGGADDGYAIFSAITSIQAVKKAGLDHGPITIVVEADEESGSGNLPFWIEKIKPELGTPDVIFCLDSGALNYDQMWLTTSLRGAINGQLKVELLAEGIHSGIFGGIVPCTFRIVRQLLSRIENEMNGEVLVPECHTDIPEDFKEQMKQLDELGPDVFTKDVPWLHEGCCGFQGLTSELGLANAWKPCLAVTGVSGLPPAENAGNVLRPYTGIVVSIRLPPAADAEKAMSAVKCVLERDPPHGARVTFSRGMQASGWCMPDLEPWLKDAVNGASEMFFNKPCGYQGLGGTIPFMGMLGEMFPSAQFVITGVLGPKSNAHGPNEFMDIAFTKKITCCVANLVNAHFVHFSK
jgi:acetylornithine deacetylase/succinyl-diaminopimelate desuccinylase-like protein|eukprot:CAMPEP_0174281312 /NCGR_PEP_ID=MMETSP0809-20121228/1687_1 /TAXON_ID=73025 ORGANISM="Eutreptiella gymnastica-like, Strain CCMP1594" /NCGR_SAMPLE_ID=MMETSP0809 /ASSEMBLY_ACC=CAM_ASM_000658 /LENGTH=476 /DNA_ID=CAMNT_0015374777 /DNA_START=30 /DNA_END=1460 /DNA_ORIENTATION=-